MTDNKINTTQEIEDISKSKEYENNNNNKNNDEKNIKVKEKIRKIIVGVVMLFFH